MASERARVFDALFACDPDPWQFETSAYEADKRAATLAALPPGRFARALEVGCATGVLTAALAPRCNRLLGLDVSARAVAAARARLADQAHVAVALAEVPGDWPEGRFDLVVLSEVLYFLSPAEIADVAVRARGSLAKDGVCLLVNWTGKNDLPVSGDEAVRLFGDAARWRTVRNETAATYRIDLLRPA